MIRVRSFGASSAQKGLWLAHTMVPGTLNHAMFLWDVDGPLDPAVLDSAFRYVLDEAEVLRVNFVDDGGGLRMVLRELGDWRPFALDVSAAADPEDAAREALADVLGKPFDLERDLLLRLGAVRLGPARSLVAVAYHHIVSDGYGAAGLLSRRLAEVYTALVRGTPVPELPHSWAAEPVAAEAERYRASAEFGADVEFWRDYLAGAPVPAQVPRIALPEPMRSALAEPMGAADRWAQLCESIGMVSRTLTVPRAEAERWTQVAMSAGVWMSSLVSAATAVFLRHRCDSEELLFSLVVANRAGAAARTPGLAVNVVPVRLRVPLGAAFAEIADALMDQTYEIFGHTVCHYSDIQQVGGTRLTERGSFGAAVNVIEGLEELDFAGARAHHISGTTGAFNELQVGVYTDGRADSDLHVRLDAPAGLYSAAELRQIGADLIEFVRAVIADPRSPVGALDVVRGDERDRVVGPTDAADASAPTLGELFARQVARDPDAVAVVSGDATVSYRTLDERATRMAESLRRRGVGPEVVVAVAVPRSVDLAVALLATVKAGGAYLPVDPSVSPAMEIGAMVRDSGARLLLADAAAAHLLALDVDVPVVLVDEVPPAAAGPDPGAPVPPRPDTVVAVSYGGGPAGRATAVALTHRNLQRFVLDPAWAEGGRGAVLWHSPYSFDVLALELWTPLVHGGRVVVAPPGELDPGSLAELPVTAAWLPARLRAAAERLGSLAGLRTVWTDAPAPAVRGVGRPEDGTSAYVLGPGLAPVPVGVVGELYVGGAGVARGCPGQPARTAERFVACPFGPPGGRMARTGDRVRWGADGAVEYVGRVDGHLRVRDAWVDPAEVEQVLSGHPGLAQAVVTVRDDRTGQPRLAAYVVPVGAEVPVEELRRFAAGLVPEWMVPTVFTVLNRLPVTAGGMVDRAALPEPEFGDGEYQAPRNAEEQVLAEAFAEVLEVERVGIDDDFFELGGNSLRAIRLVALIRTRLNVEVSIRTLFAARTITGLSAVGEDFARSSRPALRKRTKDGEVL